MTAKLPKYTNYLQFVLKILLKVLFYHKLLTKMQNGVFCNGYICQMLIFLNFFFFFFLGGGGGNIWQFTSNKAKRRISKQVFQENKDAKFFEKQTFLTRWYAHTHVKRNERWLSSYIIFFLKFTIIINLI